MVYKHHSVVFINLFWSCYFKWNQQEPFIYTDLVSLGFVRRDNWSSDGCFVWLLHVRRNFRLKIFGAPLVIGLNWVTTVIICASIANQLKVPTHFKILISIALMLFLDYFIEPVAPKIDMWSFSGIQHAPLSNYITWALVALPLQYIYHYKKLEFNLPLSVNLYISQLLFFIVLGLAL